MDDVSIDRLQFAMHACATRERADLLLARVRAVLARRLPQAIRARTPGGDDTRYLFIEQLDFDCALNAAWSDDRLARVLADALARNLAGVSAWTGHATVYHDRAEYLAAFLIALVDGSAWGDWRFDEFDGLRPVSVSSALRTVLANEGARGGDALARMTDGAARRVLQALAEADAVRLLAHFATARLPCAPPGPAILWQVLEHPLAAALAGAQQRRLAWLVVLRRTAPAHANAAGLDSLAWLDTLREAARAGRLGQAVGTHAQPAALLAACCGEAGLDTSPLAGYGPGECADLLARLGALAPPSAHLPAAAATECLYCPHGGAWLLLVRLVRLDWWVRWRDSLRQTLPAQADMLAARLALAVVARALGGRDSASIEADPALRSALGLECDPRGGRWPPGARRLIAAALALDTRDAGDWLRQHAPARRGQGLRERALQRSGYLLLWEFAQRLPGCAQSSPDHLRRQCLALDSQVRLGAQQVEVGLGRAPLDVLLVLAGLKRCSAQLPAGRALVLHAQAAP